MFGTDWALSAGACSYAPRPGRLVGRFVPSALFRIERHDIFGGTAERAYGLLQQGRSLLTLGLRLHPCRFTNSRRRMGSLPQSTAVPHPPRLFPAGHAKAPTRWAPPFRPWKYGCAFQIISTGQGEFRNSLSSGANLCITRVARTVARTRPDRSR